MQLVFSSSSTTTSADGGGCGGCGGAVTHLPSILQRHHMVNIHIAGLSPGLALVLREPRATFDTAAGARFDASAVADKDLVAGVASAEQLD